MARRQGWQGFQGMNFVPSSTQDKSSDSNTYDPPPTRRPGTGPYSNPFAIPPTQSDSGFSGVGGRPSIGAGAGGVGAGYLGSLGKRRMKDDEDEYFNDDEEPKFKEDLEYIPAPNSPSAQLKARIEAEESSANQDEDSDDPLEKFMAGVEAEVRQLDDPGTTKKGKQEKGVREDIEAEDEMEAYLRFMEENPHIGQLADEEEVYEYDEDGNIIAQHTDKKVIDPLPTLDHSEIEYAPFEKNFYQEAADIAALTGEQVDQLKQKLGIRVTGIQPPKPVCSFAHFGFPDKLIDAVRKAGFTQPSPIQAMGVPAALLGRDIIGIAKTGSGKTAAYLWPLIVHILDQPELRPGDGPIGLICAPTRELSQQIYNEAKKLAKVYNIEVVCAYGGGNLWEQQKACEAGCEILVCTPGRLIDLVKKKSTNLHRVTYLVFDEADKLFNLGFEPQVRSIANHVRPDRQTLLFSATFKKRVERLARDILTDPIRIVQGELGEANEDVTQMVEFFPKVEDKLSWLLSRLVHFTSVGSVLVFVTRKSNCVEVADKIKQREVAPVGVIHGDMHQSERNNVIQAFKKGDTKILVATDVAARGLDIPSIRTVVNFEVARDIDTHTHRIGRTGRAGQRGTAYTLMCAATPSDRELAPHLVRNFEAANQWVPPALLELANQNPWFKKNRFKGAGQGKGHSNFKARQRPGLGSTDAGGSGNYSGSSSNKPVATNRYSTMKAAFQSQYGRMFVSAGVAQDHYLHPERLGQEHTQGSTEEAANEQQDGTAKRRKRTRWE